MIWFLIYQTISIFPTTPALPQIHSAYVYKTDCLNAETTMRAGYSGRKWACCRDMLTCTPR